MITYVKFDDKDSMPPETATEMLLSGQHLTARRRKTCQQDRQRTITSPSPIRLQFVPQRDKSVRRNAKKNPEQRRRPPIANLESRKLEQCYITDPNQTAMLPDVRLDRCIRKANMTQVINAIRRANLRCVRLNREKHRLAKLLDTATAASAKAFAEVIAGRITRLDREINWQRYLRDICGKELTRRLTSEAN